MPSKSKTRSPVKSPLSVKRAAAPLRGPIPTKKFSGPLPPEEEIKMPKKNTKAVPPPAKPKASASAAKAKARPQQETRIGSPSSGGLGGRELAGLLDCHASISEGKRSRNMSEAAMLRLAAELDQAEIREFNRQKKALDEEIRAARATSELAEATAVSSSSRTNRARSETAAAPVAAATKRTKPLTRAPPSVTSILRDDKAPTHRGLTVTFGGGGAPKPQETSESEEAPAPKRQRVAKSASASTEKATRATRGSASAPSVAAPMKGEDAKAVKKEQREPLEHGELSAMNKARREAMRDSQQIVDECPSCRIPLITNPILKTIDVDCYEDRDNVARPHMNRKMCVSKNGVNEPVKAAGGKFSGRRIDVWSSIRSRIIDKFELGDDIPNEFFMPNTKKVALRNQYLTPDILMAASDFQRATEDLPMRCKLQVCAYPTWAKDVYFRLRRAYEKQVQIMINANGRPSSSNRSIARPTRVRCHCDKYNLQRCGDKNSSCCNPEMLEMEARALVEDDSEGEQ